MMELDQWQKDVIKTKGNIVLRSGRQCGKSTVISELVGDYAAKNKNKSILVIASVERQAHLLFEKILDYVHNNYKTYIKHGKDKPTKSKLTLNNGTVIRCLPTGLSGYGIRGYTIDLLVADEAAFINDEVWQAVTPMISTRIDKGARIILLSTPMGKEGYFYRCFEDPTFTTFHVSSEDCSRINKQFLGQEKARMSELEYAQEYLGEFVDELRQFFPNELIKSCMTLKGVNPSPLGINFLGVDVARKGRDDTVLFSLQRFKKRQDYKLKQLDMYITPKQMLTDTVKDILNADSKNHYRKIFIDDGGMGVGVFDPLLEHPQTKRKVIAINNSSRSIDRGGRAKKLLKEDLYNNLLNLMEKGKIELIDDDEIYLSLKSVQAEYKDGKLRIFGSYTHITEALIRAAWCTKDKSLNIWIA
jgi:hypothetical protein